MPSYDVLLGNLLGDTARGFESKPGAPWAERVAAGLGALLDHLAEHPDEARFAIVEVLAAGPKALARRDAALRQFTGFLDAGRAETSVELPGITSLSLAGGVNELLYSEILHGAASRLPSRLPDLMFWITLPFLGTERAERRARAGPALDERSTDPALLRRSFAGRAGVYATGRPPVTLAGGGVEIRGSTAGRMTAPALQRRLRGICASA